MTTLSMIRKITLNILKGLNRKINSSNWKDLRSTVPISDVFSYDRGSQSVHRYYVDKFVAQHADKIKGSVLEVGDRTYIDRHINSIAEARVIHFMETSVANGFKGDMTDKSTLPASAFDCFICTQTFNFIFDFNAAIEGAHFMLKDGGYLVATVSGIQQISQFDATQWGDYWRFTSQSSVRAFAKVFGEKNVSVISFGNVLSSVAALEGLGASELTGKELDYMDPSYELVIGIIAKKG